LQFTYNGNLHLLIYSRPGILIERGRFMKARKIAVHGAYLNSDFIHTCRMTHSWRLNDNSVSIANT